jgi:3-hydroxy-3-methylglutaryl CoA synthase
MSEIGIKSYAAFIPRLRMDRASIAAAHAWSLPALKASGKGERSFCNWDEDSITMAVEATRACLAGGSKHRVGSLVFASTTPPFADLQNASIVVNACALPASTATLDAGGSLRAGLSALIRALRTREDGDAVIVAADDRRSKPGSTQEMQYGGGALALHLGSGGIIAKLVGSASSASSFTDHFRAEGEKYDYYWEERWVRDEGYLKIIPESVERLLKEAGVRADSIDHFCMPATISGAAAAVAKRLKIKPEAVVDNLASKCGDTGTPHALMMLAVALEKATPAQKILVVGFGGGCDALLLETTDAIRSYQSASSVSAALARGVTDKNYTKLLSFGGELDLDWGMRSETDSKTALTQLYRAQDQVVSFIGGRCGNCGAIQFPHLVACVNCGSMEPLTPYPLADEPAKVATFTADWLMYYPAPPLYVGLVQFDNGARVLMEMVDVDPAKFDVGSALRMVFRIKEKDGRRHFNRYFWKAAPIY